MKYINILLASIIMGLLLGCSSSAPKCGDPASTKLVKEIASQEFTRAVGTEQMKLLALSVEAIRTTDSNEKTGKQTCAANLKVNNSKAGKNSSMPITYTVEKTDDGKNIYVSVFGLK